MRTLIIATNSTAPGVEAEIQKGRHHRVDYLELGRLPRNGYHDYNTVAENRALRWIEDQARMDLRQAVQVARLVREEGYEQVFSMSERVGIPLALLLGRDVRHVVQLAHGLSYRKLALIRTLKLPKRWDLIIAPTEAEARVLRRAFGSHSDHVKMMYYAVDTDFYCPGPDAPSAPQTDHIESLGLSYRDFPTLIQAMRSLPHIPCYIRTGSTWYTDKTVLGQAEMPDNVSLKPFVQPALLRDCYVQSRFTVIPLRSTTQWSAGCTAVMQAQSMGRAVIATRTPGMKEYIEDGVTGLLVKSSDPRAMAEAIAHLWENPALAEEMGRKARERAQKIFSIQQWMGDILQILCDNRKE